MAILGRTKRIMGVLACAGGFIVACSSGGEPEDTARATDAALLGGCSKHADCEDGNPCSQNLCVLGACALPLPVLGCCFNGSCGGSSGAGGTSTAGSGGVSTAGGGTGGALPLGCSIDDQCQDGNPCTQDLCLLGLCAPLPVLGCCYQGNCGSAGSGAGGGPLTGGCSNNDQCEDGNECTQNLCALGLCTTLPVLGCDGSAGAPPVLGCSTNDECEDGNGCHQNLCVAGLCVVLPVVGGVCGVGGAGGSGGSAGSAATAGSGGSNLAGSGGVAGGAGAGGEAGSGNSAGEPNGGTANDGGSSAQAGFAGQGGKRSDGDSGAPSNGGRGGTDAGGKASASTGGAEDEPGTGKPGATEWQMQGGGCSVATPGSSRGFVSLLLIAVGAVGLRRRRKLTARA